MRREDQDLTETQLKKAMKLGKVICLAAKNGHVRFLYQGIASGTVATPLYHKN